jgi:hypothetical protein
LRRFARTTRGRQRGYDKNCDGARFHDFVMTAWAEVSSADFGARLMSKRSQRVADE